MRQTTSSEMAPITKEHVLLDAEAIERRVAIAAGGALPATTTAQLEVEPVIELRDDGVTARTPIQTTLGVAPLEPATLGRAPHVIETRCERTAIAALDPSSGLPRPGAWTMRLARLAKRVRGVRWWFANHRRR